MLEHYRPVYSVCFIFKCLNPIDNRDLKKYFQSFYLVYKKVQSKLQLFFIVVMAVVKSLFECNQLLEVMGNLCKTCAIKHSSMSQQVKIGKVIGPNNIIYAESIN